MIIRMLEDQRKELLQIRKKNRENEDTINKLMKQLKIKNAQQAKENGSCKEWCCGSLFDNYHNFHLHREGSKHIKK